MNNIGVTSIKASSIYASLPQHVVTYSMCSTQHKFQLDSSIPKSGLHYAFLHYSTTGFQVQLLNKNIALQEPQMRNKLSGQYKISPLTAPIITSSGQKCVFCSLGIFLAVVFLEPDQFQLHKNMDTHTQKKKLHLAWCLKFV